MEYIHRGISDSDYTAYWIALELICDSHEENGIVGKLSKTYGIPFKTIKKEDTLGHKSLLRSRHNFFHKGVRPNLSADVERYFQLILLDLLRNELKLQPKQHAIAFLKTQPDLFALGLTPKRDDEAGQVKKAEPISEEIKAAVIKAYEDSFSQYRQDAKVLWPDKKGSDAE